MSERFRSVLPHEPLPRDSKGYLLLQGAFTPRLSSSQKNDDTATGTCHTHFWSRESLEQALHTLFTTRVDFLQELPFAVEEIQILDNSPPFSKVRLVYTSPVEAFYCYVAFKQHQWTPSQVLTLPQIGSNESLVQVDSTTDISCEYHFSSRPFLVTQITQQSLLGNNDIEWIRSSPPKFRRFLPREDENAEDLQHEKETTRFLFLSNLTTSSIDSCYSLNWNDAHCLAHAIRLVLNKFDTSGHGIEVFVNNSRKMHQYCHIGMRSAADAQRVFSYFSQNPKVTWTLTDAMGNTSTASTKTLFVDYAGVTHRSVRRVQDHTDGSKDVKGEPPRSECTSSTNHVEVPGLYLIQNFISQAEEEVLMAVLTGPHAPWAPSQFTPTEGRVVKRKVQHYGYVFDYKTANVLRDRSKDDGNCPEMPKIPEQLSSSSSETLQSQIDAYVRESRGWETFAAVVEKIRRHRFCSDNGTTTTFQSLNQLTINCYEPGEGIGSHVDTPSAFSDGLISLSLNGGVVMEFRKAEQDSKDVQKKLVYLPPRSLLLMSGPARYEWEHMIMSRMTDTVDGAVLRRKTRLSLTLRTALDTNDGPLPLVESSKFPLSWKVSRIDQQSALATPDCERLHVHAVYDAIATQWHHTRGKRGVLWPGATQFLQRLPKNSIVADIGCGDGKYFPAIIEAGSYVIGSDISLPLLQTTISSSQQNGQEPESRRVSEEYRHLKKYPEVVAADCLNIPLRSKSCDAAICIAVMHHLSTESRRKRCIQELVRIVKAGGLINIQAWAIDQQEDSRHRFASNDVFVPFNAQPKYLKTEHTSIVGEVDNQQHLDDSESTYGSAAQFCSKQYNAQYDNNKGLVVFQRYCHLYRQGELDAIVKGIKNTQIVDSGYEAGNYFVILQVLHNNYSSD